MPNFETVDLVVLSRDMAPLDPRVQSAIDSQQGVTIKLHRVVGTRREDDVNKWVTISRARNRARACGQSRWFMFLDDDVVIPPDCVARLVQALKEGAPTLGAVAADYQGMARQKHGVVEHHVSMGATLFDRRILHRFNFRASQTKCDCQHCCEDLRRQLVGVEYADGLFAEHIDIGECNSVGASPGSARPERDVDSTALPSTQVHGRCEAADTQPIVMVAFDGRDHFAFCDQFLPSFRRSGNQDTVTAITYGLNPSSLAKIQTHDNVRTVNLPAARQNEKVAIIRMLGFRDYLASLPEYTPVAFWDAGDVVFQDSIAPLWQLVDSHPGKVLAVREYKDVTNGMDTWTATIRNQESRKEVDDVLAGKFPFNGGFAASTAGCMKSYFDKAIELSTTSLAGAVGVDQLAMNVIAYTSSLIVEAGSEWNYVLIGRPSLGRASFSPDGRFHHDSARIRVVHGALSSLHTIAGYGKFRSNPFGQFS